MPPVAIPHVPNPQSAIETCRRTSYAHMVARFVALIHARDRVDREQMRAARSELARLGVRVSFGSPAKRTRHRKGGK